MKVFPERDGNLLEIHELSRLLLNVRMKVFPERDGNLVTKEMCFTSKWKVRMKVFPERDGNVSVSLTHQSCKVGGPNEGLP